MENIIENKIVFMSKYYGQKVLRSYFPEQKGLSEIGSMQFHIQHLLMNGYLELKSLSQITNEDVLKIAELLSWRKFMTESSIIAQTKELLIHQSQTNLYREHWSDIIDKVRELGYAHKWNGVTVEKQIEYGWIKLVN